MIKETLPIETKSLKERGIHDESYFHVVFSDGGEAKEHDTNWSDIAEETVIIHMGKKKMCNLSTKPIKTISIICKYLNTSIDLQEGERVYQSIKSSLKLDGSGNQTSKIIGRTVGIVKNGAMVEERFLSTETNQIFGIRPLNNSL